MVIDSPGEDKNIITLVDDDSVTVPSTSKKRGKKLVLAQNDEDKKRFLHGVKQNVCDALRGAWEASANEDELMPFCRQLKNTYLKMKSAQIPDTDFFFGELRHRLNFMMESATQIEKRRNVFRMVVVTALNIAKDSSSELIDFLVEYAADLENVDEGAVRQNTVALVGYLFRHWPLPGANVSGMDKKPMSTETRDRLYAILRRRQLDKAVNVRSEVTRAAMTMQEHEIANDFELAVERSPKDIILMGLRDVSPECRLAAVLAIDLRSKVVEHIDAVIDIATCDKNTKVRLAAIQRLSRLTPQALTSVQLMELLPCLVSDCDGVIKDAAHNILLSSWLPLIATAQKKKLTKAPPPKDASADDQHEDESSIMESERNHGLGVATLLLIGKLDFANKTETIESIAFACFDVIRDILGLGHRYSVADLVASFSNDVTVPAPILNYNYKEILNRKHAPRFQALLAFYWRCLADYCMRNIDDVTSKSAEVQRSECRRRLAPTLKTVCEVVAKLDTLDSLATFESTEDELFGLTMKQVALKEVLVFCTFLERDTVGMEAWKKTLESLLNDISLSKDITDHIMLTLLDVHYKDNPEDALVTVTDITSSLVDRDLNPDATIMMDQTMPDQPPQTEVREEVMSYCMQLTNSLLKTGAFTSIHPIIRNAYDTLILKCIKSQNGRLRQWAIEASAILGNIDERIAKNMFTVVMLALDVDDVDTQVSCLAALCDWIIVLGYEKVNSWVSLLPRSGDDDQLSIIFSEIIKQPTPDADLCLMASECASKIMLLHPRDPNEPHWVDLATALLMRLFHPSASKRPDLKSLLSQFFFMFANIRRTNQLMLLNVFDRVMAELREGAESPFVSRFSLNIDKAVICITQWTRKGVLSPSEIEATVEETPVHLLFLGRLLEFLSNNPDDTLIRLYCQSAAILELDGLAPEKAAQLQEEFSAVYDLLCDTLGNKTKSATELKKLLRRLEIITEGGEADDIVVDLRESTPLPKRRGMSCTTPRTAPRTTRKASSTSKKSRTVERDLGSDEEEVVATVVRDRQMLPRTAKKTKTVALFRDFRD